MTGALAVVLRPYNPEGISFVDRIEVTAAPFGWRVNRRAAVEFDRAPVRQVLSTYQGGDVAQRLGAAGSDAAVNCPAGMATAMALFPAAALRSAPLRLRVPVGDDTEPKRRTAPQTSPGWPAALAPLARLQVGAPRVQQLYDLAVATLVLHAPGEVFPGPYTYKRFWFRDATFILHALLQLGAVERVRRCLAGFAPRQRRDGYFLSQEGEWDSNGEALWFYHRFAQATGESLPAPWLAAVKKGARWISRKRTPSRAGQATAGLLPAGFSAEHLGPNDFYYWDDFWGVAGLRAAAALWSGPDPGFATACEAEATAFLACIERSFPAGPHRRFPGAVPASPLRRMDSGAVGSLVADYPLQLLAPGDPRILGTADYLRDHSCHAGGFFQQMIHSGINPYLSLHLAQVRLRAGQTAEAWQLMDRVAELASPTGQWPEAIHPRTGGGCMGDGQHVWAAAEWTLMVRNCFVREEADRLIITPGVPPGWWRHGGAAFGPTLTAYRPVRISIQGFPDRPAVRVEGVWRGSAPRLELRLPGYPRCIRPPRAGAQEFPLS